MDLQNLYLCVLTVDNDSDVITDIDHKELLIKVIDNLFNTYGDDFPDLQQFKTENSIDFISEYGEDDYQNTINEILCYLATQENHINAKVIKVDPEFNQDTL